MTPQHVHMETLPMPPPKTDAEVVIYRLEEAGRTLLALPATGTMPAGYGNGWPQVVHAAIMAYGWEGERSRPAVPSANAITRMDEALRWVSLIPLCKAGSSVPEPWSSHGGAILRRLVMMRALVSPVTERHLWTWRRIGLSMGMSHECARNWHGQAVDKIVVKLAKSRALAA